MLGAQAALQEYDGIWRFAWSHNAQGLLKPQSIHYFNVANDPLTCRTRGRFMRPMAHAAARCRSSRMVGRSRSPLTPPVIPPRRLAITKSSASRNRSSN